MRDQALQRELLELELELTRIDLILTFERERLSAKPKEGREEARPPNGPNR